VYKNPLPPLHLLTSTHHEVLEYHPPKRPWWNDELANLKQRMRQTYRKWRKKKKKTTPETSTISPAVLAPCLARDWRCSAACAANGFMRSALHSCYPRRKSVIQETWSGFVDPAQRLPSLAKDIYRRIVWDWRWSFATLLTTTQSTLTYVKKVCTPFSGQLLSCLGVGHFFQHIIV
jgi:hypothetical protein